MVDWKRCNPNPRRAGQPKELLGPDQRAFANEKGTGPCSDLQNTSFWHYVVQQRIYTCAPFLRLYLWGLSLTHVRLRARRYILETHYGMEVDSSWLVQLHPALGAAHYVEVPRIDDVVAQIMHLRYEQVRDAKRRKE